MGALEVNGVAISITIEETRPVDENSMQFVNFEDDILFARPRNAWTFLDAKG